MIHVLHFGHSPLPPMTVKTGIVSKTGTVSKCINLSDLMTVVSRSVTARILVPPKNGFEPLKWLWTDLLWNLRSPTQKCSNFQNFTPWTMIKLNFATIERYVVLIRKQLNCSVAFHLLTGDETSKFWWGTIFHTSRLPSHFKPDFNSVYSFMCARNILCTFITAIAARRFYILSALHMFTYLIHCSPW